MLFVIQSREEEEENVEWMEFTDALLNGSSSNNKTVGDTHAI